MHRRPPPVPPLLLAAVALGLLLVLLLLGGGAGRAQGAMLELVPTQSFLTSRTVGNMTYGPYVCEVTSRCDPTFGTPLGRCEHHHVNSLSRYNLCAGTGYPVECPDVCTEGAFCEKRRVTNRLDGTKLCSSYTTDCNPTDQNPDPCYTLGKGAKNDVGWLRLMYGWTLALPSRDVSKPCALMDFPCANCWRQTQPQTFATALGPVTVPPQDVCCPPGMGGDDCSRQVFCRSSADCNGGVCYPDLFTCINCPLGKTGPTCTDDAPAASLVSYTSGAQVGAVAFGAHVCGVTAPCITTTFGVVLPAGVCGVDYQRSLTSPYNDCSPICKDVCTTGPFCDQRVSGHPTTVYCRDSQSNRLFTLPAGFACPSTSAPLPVASYNCDQPRAQPLWLHGGALVLTGPRPPCATHAGGCSYCAAQQADHVFNVTGALRLVPKSDVCCSVGLRGDLCDEDVGCALGDCLHGGTCLAADKDGLAVPVADQRCFGCDPGWTGRFCEEALPPTFTLVNATQAELDAAAGGGGGGAGRRLLQASEEDGVTEVLRRTTSERVSDLNGRIYKEPARVCDCGVAWNDSGHAPMDQDYSKPLMLMGNYHTLDRPVLLSPVDFRGAADAPAIYRRKLAYEEDAHFHCARDWDCGGYYWSPSTSFVSFWSRGAFPSSLPGPTLASLWGPPPPDTVRVTLTRLVDPVQCPGGATLAPRFYCDFYPSQCASVRAQGGVGNYRLSAANNDTATVAMLHFRAFGHRTRNFPNPTCDLTVQWAEDEQGCSSALRAPKFVFPPSAQDLTDAVCGNSSRVPAERVAFGPLQPNVTGFLVMDSGDALCECYPPFETTNPAVRHDCAYDLCGRVDGRGQINATYANALDHPSHFNHSDPAACVCHGVWGTDPLSCAGQAGRCDWCAAAYCENGGRPPLANNAVGDPVCDCLPIFVGDRCETSLCHPDHSHPFNATDWALKQHPPERAACDCHEGWTGPLCDRKQCVHGTFDRNSQTCDCLPGFVGALCDEPVCAPDQGTWNATGGLNATGGCDCVAPWAGPRCREHTCDEHNAVLADPTWAGVRPFGQPERLAEDGRWHCGCNWPYAPQRVDNGRNLDCAAHDCHFGVPSPRPWTLPQDACACHDPAGIGLTTDPLTCDGTRCSDACKRATCHIDPTRFGNDSALGLLVPVGDTPDCCRCPAAAGYEIVGECQPFCVFYAPCVHVEGRSSFAPNPNYNPNLTYTYPDPYVQREADRANQRWLCKCNAEYSNSDPDTNDCSVRTVVPPDIGRNETNWWYGPGNPPPPPPPEPTESATTASVMSNPITIGVLSAVGGLVAVSAGIGMFQQYSEAKAPQGDSQGERAALVPTAQPVTVNLVLDSSMLRAQGRLGSRLDREGQRTAPSRPSATGSAQSSSSYNRQLLYWFCGLLVAGLLIGLGASAEPFVWPRSGMWSKTERWATCRVHPDAQINRASYQVPGGDLVNGQWTRAVLMEPYADELHGPLPYNSGLANTCPNDYTWGSALMTEYWSGRDMHGLGTPLEPYLPPGPMPKPEALYYDSRLNHVTDGDTKFTVAYSFPAGYPIRIGDTETDSSNVLYKTWGWRDTTTSSGTHLMNVISLCDRNARCGNGTCVLAYADVTRDTKRWTDRCDPAAVCVRRDIDFNKLFYWEHFLHGIQGCKCNNGFYGLQCDQVCPMNHRNVTISTSVRELCLGQHGIPCNYMDLYNDHDMCSGNGRCATNRAVTHATDLRTCMCDGGCVCNQGYTGDRCERAIQSMGAPASKKPGTSIVVYEARSPLQDFSRCCPLDNPDCTPIRSRRDPTKVCTPTVPCNQTDPATAPSCKCDSEDYRDSEHVKQPDPDAPYKCGEGLQESEPGWFANLAGRGKCYIGAGQLSSQLTDSEADAGFWQYKPSSQIPEHTGFCWCNTPPSNATDREINGRRGWFGPNCQYRTCTRPRPSWNRPDASGLLENFQPPATTLQCNGKSHGEFNSTSNHYSDDHTPCEDRVQGERGQYTEVNTPGYCKRCADGWGYFTGFRKSDLQKAGYDTSINGLCNVKTYHTNWDPRTNTGDVPCGGYGTPTKRTVARLRFKDGSNNYVTNAQYTSNCTCPESWGLRTTDSGLCLRTCDNGSGTIPLLPNMTDAYGNFNLSYAVNITGPMPSRCGSFRQGLCRPIQYGERSDGFNSACMCNPGYNGYNCIKIDRMWAEGQVCGPKGEGVLRAPPANATRLSPYDDADWFYRHIVPLNGPEILTSDKYSAYQCRCRAEWAAKGYVANADGICVRGPTAPELFAPTGEGGLACSGHGRIALDPDPTVEPHARGFRCMCDLGWNGTRCGDRILHDGLGQPCGGADRGSIVYTNAFNLTQRCACQPPFIEHLGPKGALCWLPCPNNCTSADRGSCLSSPGPAQNDDKCACKGIAWGGDDCSKRLVAMYRTPSGNELPCTGHGVPDPDGTTYCKCDEGWTGDVCEVYRPNRQCGAGQPVLDSESVGIAIVR